MELTPAVVPLPRALDARSVAALTHALAAATASAAPIVSLTGAGEGVFCSGLALEAITGGTPATGAFGELLATMHASPKPLLAVVDGAAIGGGLGLACACDWVVATERATFALPELLWGLVPAIIWPVVTDRMAPHVARQWTLSARSRTAADAVTAGVVDDLVAVAALDLGVRRASRTLGRLEPEALRRLRSWARESRALPLPEALGRGAAVTAAMMETPTVRRRWRAYDEGAAPWSA